MRRISLVLAALVAALGIAVTPVAAIANQILFYYQPAQVSLADGPFPVTACNQVVGQAGCLGELAGIDHAFISLTPAVCTVAETTPPGVNYSTAAVTPVTTGTCVIRVLATGPGVGPNAGAKSAQRQTVIVP